MSEEHVKPLAHDNWEHTPHLDDAVRREPHPMTDNNRALAELESLKARLRHPQRIALGRNFDNLIVSPEHLGEIMRIMLEVCEAADDYSGNGRSGGSVDTTFLNKRWDDMLAALRLFREKVPSRRIKW